MKQSFILRKFRQFAIDRALPVTMLWLGTAFFLQILNVVITALRTPTNTASGTNGTVIPAAPIDVIGLGTFVDPRLMLALLIGVLVILGFFSLIRNNLEPDQDVSRRLNEFSDKLWDEVSSAATHVGSILLISSFFRNIDFFIASATFWEKFMAVGLFFLIGALTYNSSAMVQSENDEAVSRLTIIRDRKIDTDSSIASRHPFPIIKRKRRRLRIRVSIFD